MYVLPNLEDELRKRVEFLLKAKDNINLQQIEIELCKRDILYFCRNYLYTDKNTTLFHQKNNVIPFIPFPFQEECITEIWASIVEGTKPIEERKEFTNVFIEKSRQMGLSWVILAVLLYGYIFHNHKYLCLSEKEELVDTKGDMKSLFEKIRFMIKNLPRWMVPFLYEQNDKKKYEISEKKYLKFKNIIRPDGTGSITGESTNNNAGTGGTYQAVFLDEMAKMGNGHSINTSVASATPCRIFNSTPYGEGNEYYRMRKLTQTRKSPNGEILKPEIKGLRYHRTDHPLYSIDWYKWKTKGMTPEQIAQDLEIDYNTAIEGRVYPEFPKEPTLLLYDMTKPLYVCIDNSHGGKDPNAIIIIQPDGVYWNILDAVEISCTPEQCAEFLITQPKFMMNNIQLDFLERYKQLNWKKAVFISDPYDTKSAMGNSTILDDYRKVGINLMLPSERRKEEQILKTRTNMYRVRYTENCLDFASAIMNSKYPERKEDSQSTRPFTLPVHNQFSHYRTALEYFVTYFLENPLLTKERIIEDKRPIRDFMGRLIYK